MTSSWSQYVKLGLSDSKPVGPLTIRVSEIFGGTSCGWERGILCCYPPSNPTLKRGAGSRDPRELSGPSFQWSSLCGRSLSWAAHS